MPDRLNPIEWANTGYDWLMGQDDYYDVELNLRETSKQERDVSSLPKCLGSSLIEWHDCEGAYTFRNGDHYVGKWENGKRTGPGTFTWSDGEKYVGEFKNDWLGNEIKIDRLKDPKVQGITCHVTYFDRGGWDRIGKGNWFEDPSNASIACRQTGPIIIGDIDKDKDGEDVFRQSRSIILKSLRVKRIWDEANQTLIYVAHAAELTDGSAKVSISTVPLYSSD